MCFMQSHGSLIPLVRHQLIQANTVSTPCGAGGSLELLNTCKILICTSGFRTETDIVKCKVQMQVWNYCDPSKIEKISSWDVVRFTWHSRHRAPSQPPAVPRMPGTPSVALRSLSCCLLWCRQCHTLVSLENHSKFIFGLKYGVLQM